jgi:phage I-like protein
VAQPGKAVSEADLWAAAAMRQRRTLSDLDWDLAKYARAVRSADAGSLRQLADFCDWLLTDGRVSGAMEQATAMFGLAPRFECDPALAAQLAHDMPRQFPEAEQERLFTWGLVLGIGCARVEYSWLHLIEPRANVRAWDMQHFSLRRDYFDGAPIDRVYVMTDAGEECVEPGRGWIVFRPFGEYEPTKRGLARKLARPVLGKDQFSMDRLRTSEVTPIIVGITSGLSEPQRVRFRDDLLPSEDTRVVLPKGCDLKAVDVSSGTRGSIQKDGIEDAKEEIATIINGTAVTIEGSSGFSNGDVQMGVAEAVVAKREQSFSTTIGEQFTTEWARIAYGYIGPTVYPRWLGATNATAANDQADAGTAPLLTPASTPADATGGASPSAPVAPPADDVALSTDDQTDAAVESYAAELTDAQERACEHGRSNKCTICGIERVRALKRGESGEVIRDEDGRAVHAIQWRPITTARVAMAASAVSTMRRPWKHGWSLAALGTEPPKRVLLFKWGANDSDYGPVYLTRPEAEAAIKANGNRGIMFDLEHMSLNRDDASKHYDPRAMGHADRLGLDDVGMWAEDITWTEEGDGRIRRRETRFTSPAFDVDEKQRVIAITNCAITALPATRNITPLVAASATGTKTRARGNMDEKALVQFALMIAGLPLDAPLEDLADKIREKFTGEPAAAPVEEVMDPAAMAADPAAVPEAMSVIRSKLQGDAKSLAMLDAMEQTATQAKLALSRVAAMEKAGEDRERAAIFKEHANKFTADSAKAYAKAPIDALRTFVQFAAPIADSRKLTPPRAAGGDVLTPELKAYADKHKIDHATFARRLSDPRYSHLLTKGQA